MPIWKRGGAAKYAEDANPNLHSPARSGFFANLARFKKFLGRGFGPRFLLDRRSSPTRFRQNSSAPNRCQDIYYNIIN